MNSLQETELQILKVIIDICDRLELRYYLVCGSALGAVKYHGFIPWDDDVDIGLFRDDYEKFCSYAPRFLPKYYFLQNYKTDKNFPAIYSKVRDSRTTFIEKNVRNLDIHHGVYVDVFPLDGYPTRAVVPFEVKKQLLKYSLFCSFDYNSEISIKVKILYRLSRMIGLHKKTSIILKKLDRLVTIYPINKSSLVCNHGNWQGKLEYAPKEQYGSGVMMEFEGIKVRVPERYDEYLTQKYGDWRADLPESEKIGHHYYEVCDLKRPYTYYKK